MAEQRQAPELCPACKDGQHMWSMVGECRCWACYCTARRGYPSSSAHPIEETSE